MKDFTEQEREQMDRYIHGILSDGERSAFEKRLLNEPDLATEVQWLRKFYVNYEYMRVEDKVREIHKELAEEGVLATRHVEHVYWTTWRMAMAASVVLVLGIGTWYWLDHKTSTEIAGNNQKKVNSTTDTSSIAPPTSLTEPAKDSVTTPSLPPGPTPDQLAVRYGAQSPKGVGEVPNELTIAVADYKRGGKQLNSAIEVLQKPVPAAPNPNEEYGASKSATLQENQTAYAYRHLYLGLSYLKNKQASKALDALNQVKSNPLTQTVQWYKALCYVQLGKVDDAQKLLDQIQKQANHPYQTEAGNLAASLPKPTQ